MTLSTHKLPLPAAYGVDSYLSWRYWRARLPRPSAVGPHTVLDPAHWSGCIPRISRPRPRWGGHEVCVRCQRPLQEETAQQRPILGHWCWTCSADDEGCDAKVAQNILRHRHEIDRRLAWSSAACTHLIVVQDVFGRAFGYGNYYVGVGADQDVEGIADCYRRMEAVVVSEILPCVQG